MLLLHTDRGEGVEEFLISSSMTLLCIARVSRLLPRLPSDLFKDFVCPNDNILDFWPPRQWDLYIVLPNQETQALHRADTSVRKWSVFGAHHSLVRTKLLISSDVRHTATQPCKGCRALHLGKHITKDHEVFTELLLRDICKSHGPIVSRKDILSWLMAYWLRGGHEEHDTTLKSFDVPPSEPPQGPGAK